VKNNQARLNLFFRAASYLIKSRAEANENGVFRFDYGGT